jgi:hypothetical protein
MGANFRVFIAILRPTGIAAPEFALAERYILATFDVAVEDQGGAT